ncbi:MAG: DNRLRE domain-containing protein [Planctomycetia bacterium]|nr:DNRLRE domain-containing protein [Planctomycetia bacterium]
MDTYLNNNNLSTNYGSTSPLQIGTALEGKNAAVCRALLRFDLSLIPAGSSINSATLTLTNTGSGAVLIANGFELRRVTQQNWTEAGATWSTYNGTSNWNVPGGDTSLVNSSTVTLAHAGDNVVFNDANVVALITDAIANRANLLQLLVKRASEPGTQDFGAFYSSENGTPANRPTLVVAYTPPASLRPAPFSSGFQDLVGNLF